MPKPSSHKLIKTLAAAALLSAAAAGYYFTGPGGKKHQAKAKAWIKAAKKDLAGKILQMESLSRRGYDKAAQEVMAKYRRAKSIKPEELAAFGQELKVHWKNIAKKAKGLGAAKKPPKKKPAKK